MNKLRVLDLFSGIGGFSLGLERTGGFETVAFCEIEPFPRKVLARHWPKVPIYDDVRTLDYDGTVDVITGGYPCQPFSAAGKRQGADDDRHLWPSMLSLIKKHRPAWVIGENVVGYISMGLDEVLSDLEGADYATRAFDIPACAVGADHIRHRVWILAYAESAGEWREVGNLRQKNGRQDCELFLKSDGAIALSSDTNGFGKLQSQGRKQDFWRWIGNSLGWEPEPGMDRVAYGLPNQLDRTSALGNAVVPQIPELIGNAILQSMRAQDAA
jgi:DNA (cytosine-5)-methyltransferase 1